MKKLPIIPNGYEIIQDRSGKIQIGDMWSYYSILDIHVWLHTKRIGEDFLDYNVYIRKVK